MPSKKEKKKKKIVVWKLSPSEKETKVYSHQIILDSFLKDTFIIYGGENITVKHKSLSFIFCWNLMVQCAVFVLKLPLCQRKE